jgi:hypothetical protein
VVGTNVASSSCPSSQPCSPGSTRHGHRPRPGLGQIRSIGIYPTITVWINGTQISEIDLEHLEYPHYDKESMLGMLGRSGPIGLEVHENDPSLGETRWGKEAKCRWRNLKVLEL